MEGSDILKHESHEAYMTRRMTELEQEEYNIMNEEGDIDADDYSAIINRVLGLANEDVEGLHVSEQSYGDSWKQRGGVGAFMMLARKWDRLEKQVADWNYDVFQTADEDRREEGVLDDIRDLRRYLFLVEAEVRMRQNGKQPKAR
mgnify:CR=1 FL=1|jgi:hypothetical protein|tara:strand:- start:413 stop:847 length:435 start_codon:yes stop_codon:yes gene_type:complete